VDQNLKNDQDDRSGLIIGGSILIGVGLLFFLVNLDILPGFHKSWPVFIIIVGLSLLLGSLGKRKRRKKDDQI